MIKRKTEPNESFEPTQDAIAGKGHRLGRQRTPDRDEGRVRPADERPVERLILDGTLLDLELEEGGGDHTPNYKVRVERLFRHCTLSLTSVPGRRERR